MGKRMPVEPKGEAISGTTLKRKGISIIGSADVTLLNAGVLVYMSTPWARWFLEKTWAFPTYATPNREQGVMVAFLAGCEPGSSHVQIRSA